MEVVNSVPVKKGDVFFIEAGTLHAIGKGILIAEIQQNSNTTYRVYDYGRLGNDGKPRPLHIEKAAEVTNLFPAKPHSVGEKIDCGGYDETLLACCDYFTVKSVEVKTTARFEADEKSFHSIWFLTDIKLNYDGKEMKISKGDSVFIPAGMGEYSIVGACNFILTTV